jgi:Superoxide dismutase
MQSRAGVSASASKVTLAHWAHCRNLQPARGTAAGDGWIWLVEQADGRLAVTSHPGIGNPLTGTSRPVLACPLDHTLWDSPGNSDRRAG